MRPMRIHGTRLSKAGNLLAPLEELAPGVRGCTREESGVLWLSFIVAMRPGAGDVGRYLDALPRDRTVVVPCVVSSRMAGMLGRRGFVSHMEHVDGMGEVDVWTREAGVRRAAA